MRHIKNGGVELGILQAAKKYGEITEEQEYRMQYLESLPKNVWIALDDNGVAITEEEAMEIEKQELKKYKVLK